MKAAPYITMCATAGAMLGLLALPTAAGALPPSEADASDACVPGGTATLMPETASEYARMCSEYVGVPPTINCGNGVRVPIHVDGVEVFESPGYRKCDNPDFKGNCNVGSKIGRVQGTAADGTPLPDVVWAYLCRSAGQELFERGIASVQMIGHNKTTGASCFFESPDAVGNLVQAEYLRFDEDGLLEGELPGPDSPDFDRAWIPPPDGVQCAQCHHNNVFLHDPWIDGARLPSNPREPVLPQWVDPEAPYWVVGGTDWDLRTVHIEGNACLDCHRAPTRTARLLEAGKVHVNDFMPPRKPGSMAADYAALLACHDDGPENTPGCDWIVPPGGGCEGGMVSGVAGDGEGGRVPTGRVKEVADDCLGQCVAKRVGKADCERACSAIKTAKK